LDIVLPEDPAIPLLGIYPEDVPTSKKDTYATMFIAALFIIARSWKEEHSFIFGVIANLYNHSGISLSVPQKIGHSTTRGPSYTTPGHISKTCSNMLQGHMLCYVHRSLIYNSQNLERTQMSLNRGIDTENTHLHNGVLLSYSKP
jgi:hypothetical protein